MPGQDAFRIGEWVVRPDVGTITQGTQTVTLEPRVMDLLCFLAEHAQEVLTKERLIHAIWPDTFVADDVLSSAIWKLRQAVGDDSKNAVYVKTIPRRGYQFIAETVFPEEQTKDPNRYRLSDKLGEGGTGEVYLAQDQELGRNVALKFLRRENESDDIWHRRLMREARAAAALDHPYICKIYETGKLGDRSFIAMEYVQGQKLSERLNQGAMPWRESLQIAVEMTEALEEAHRHGIVHRDIKPSNVIVTEQGHVKITDFGIAKRFRKDSTGQRDQEWTLTATVLGTVTGSPGYMSPEQIRGEPVDHRTDLFQLGVVLYEMVTGVHPFRRETHADTTSAILNEGPPPVSPGPHGGFPPLFEHCLAKLLAKDPERRYQSAHEVRTDLFEIIDAGHSQAKGGAGEDAGHPSTLAQRRIHRGFWLLASLLVLVAAALIAGAVLTMDQVPAEAPVMTLNIRLPDEIPLNVGTGDGGSIVISPNGRELVYAGKSDDGQRLYRRSISADGVTAIPESLGATTPFFSPDSRWLGFFVDNELYRSNLSGPPRRLARVFGQRLGAAWAEDGSVYFGASATRKPGCTFFGQ
jgi:eukaryotic-like serine/threonine-protein kinase